MITTSIAINSKFDTKMKKSIEESLGRNKLYDVVYYYYSLCPDINYTMLFVRSEPACRDYAKILTSIYKNMGIYVSIDARKIELSFYKEGEIAYGIKTSHPREMDIGGNFVVEVEGDVKKLYENYSGINSDELNRKIYGNGLYFFFRRSYIVNIFESLKLGSLSPLVYWDWELISSYKQRVRTKWKEELVRRKEFTNLHEVKIMPSY